MALNGVTCTMIPAGAVVQLQQYTGTTTEATLTEEKEVAFPNGAYVMTMAQENSYILAVRMEPDMGDGSSNTVTFAQEGTIPSEDGVFPIYRYIHDLNEDGFINYDQAFAAPSEVVAEGATVIGGTGKITGLDANKTYEYRAVDAEEYTAVEPGSTEIAELPLGKYLVRYPVTENGLPSADAEITVGYALEKYAVYVDSASGSDDNDGYTAALAVSTFQQAQNQLDKLMLHAPAETTGEIHLVGTYNMTKASSGYLSLQAHNYPLLVTGGTLIFTDNKNEQKFLRMGGDTTFDDITLQVGSNSNAYYLCGEGHKLTIGDNVTTPAYSSKYFNIMGGTGVFSNNSYAAQTDVTVLSGTWRYVFAGGYVSSVTGDAKLKASGCSVSRIGGSHNGKLDGDLYMELDNITVRSSFALYGGNMQKNNVEGNVTMVLGEDINAAAVYAGSLEGGNVGGTVTIVADGVDLSRVPIYGNPNNTTGTIGGLALVMNQGQLAGVAESFITRDGVSVKVSCEQEETVKLPYDIALELDGVDLNVDLNGHDITAATTGNNKLYCYDSVTDDYDVEGETYGTVPAGTAMAAPGYLAVTEDNKTSFHKYELKMDSLVVNTVKRGITYESVFHGDQKVKSQIREFGVAMRAYNAPNEMSIWADPECKTHVVRGSSNWATGNNDNELKSVYVENIIATDLSAEENQARSDVKVYGRAYIQLTDGTMLFSNAVGFSLQETMEHMDGYFGSEYLDDEEEQKLVAFYLTDAYHSFMQNWELPNIKNQAGE